MDDSERPSGDPRGRILAPAWMSARQRERWQRDRRYDVEVEHARFTAFTAWLAAIAFAVSALRAAVAVWPH